MPKRGPKPTYDAGRHPILVKCLARVGRTVAQIAAELAVAESTLYRWADAHEELREALKEGRAQADALVEDCLFRRATGYDYKDKEVRRVTVTDEVADAGGRAGLGGTTRRVTKTTTTERVVHYHVPADVTAQIFWLKNRRPDLYRDKRDPNDVPGKEGVQIDESKLTAEDTKTLLDVAARVTVAPAGR